MIALCGLWLAEARTPARVPVVAASFILAVVSVEFATIFTNAMMPDLVPRHQLGRLSGTGWAVGYAGGLVSLIIAAGLLVADPETGFTILGLKSPLPLDAFAYEGERAIGPFSALWYGIFILPFFLFTPDRANAKTATSSAIEQGLRQLVETFRQLRRYGAIFRFLLARMLYVDGLGAIFTFGGLYAASVFGWGTLQLGLFGIILTIAGAAGSFAGGWLDDAIGSRALILGALAGIMAAALGIVSVDRDTVLFVMDVEATKAGSVPFVSPAEQVYIGFAIIVGLLAGPLQSGSRTYLARAAPPDMIDRVFRPVRLFRQGVRLRRATAGRSGDDNGAEPAGRCRGDIAVSGRWFRSDAERSARDTGALTPSAPIATC